MRAFLKDLIWRWRYRNGGCFAKFHDSSTPELYAIGRAIGLAGEAPEWGCTLPKGHAGPHVAHGLDDQVIAVENQLMDWC